MRRDSPPRSGFSGRFQLFQQDHLRSHSPRGSACLSRDGIWDTHCHLQLEPLYSEAELCLKSAARLGVSGCLVPSYGPREWPKQEALLHLEGVELALGIHPWCVAGEDISDLLAQLDHGFRTYPSIWAGHLRAVGEFGLDRSSSRWKDCFEAQCQLFSQHLRWAQALSLPVIIHSVGAHGATQELLKEGPPLPGGVLHSYAGPKELIPVYGELGLCFSYSGNLAHSKKAQESLRNTPSEHLLFETDGPQGPKVCQEETLSPAALPQVISLAAKILDRSEEWCRSVHRENTCRVFGLGCPDK